MSNLSERFHQEHRETVQQLTDSLNSLIHIYKNGMIPGEPEKTNAIYMLNTYIDTLIEFKKTKTSLFKRVKEEDDQDYDETLALKELSENIKGLDLLLKMGREKLILANDPILYTDAGRFLRESKYCEEIVLTNTDTHYYILSPKGVGVLKNKELMTSLRKILCTSIIPQRMISDSFKWSNLYIRRVEMINRFYRLKRGNIDHIICSLDEDKDMVLGCEMSDSDQTIYAFAGIFDEKINAHISQLKSIICSGLIDKLIIINSSEDDKRMLECEGLVKSNCPQLEYALLY